MKAIRTTFLLTLVLGLLSFIYGFFQPLWMKASINAMFLISIPLCVVGGFRLMFERGAFRFMQYSFYKVGQSLGLNGGSKKKQYIDMVEKDEDKEPNQTKAKEPAKSKEDLLYGEIAQWGYADALFYTGVILLASSFILSFMAMA